MKHLLTALTTLALLFTASLAAAQSLEDIQASGTIRIATANEIPYGWVDEAGEAHGIGPDVAEAVLAEMGIENIEWTVTEFGSLIPGLIAGRFDMVAAEQAILPDRCQVVLYSSPSSSYGEGLLVAAGNPEDIHGYEDFVENPQLTMGIVSGADQLDFAQAMGIGEGQLVTIASNTDALSAVETGRISAYAATGLTASRLAENSDRVELAQPFTDPVVDGEPVRSWGGFTFSQDAGELRDAYNEALAAFQATPEWKELLTSHGLTEGDVAAVSERTTEQLCAAE
jgi:polar amino acid transport system substrate-binding protein